MDKLLGGVIFAHDQSIGSQGAQENGGEIHVSYPAELPAKTRRMPQREDTDA